MSIITAEMIEQAINAPMHIITLQSDDPRVEEAYRLSEKVSSTRLAQHPKGTYPQDWCMYMGAPGNIKLIFGSIDEESGKIHWGLAGNCPESDCGKEFFLLNPENPSWTPNPFR